MASAALNVLAIRRLNSYEITGSHGCPSHALEDLVVEHLTLRHELEALTASEEVAARMLVEGYSSVEIALELGCSVRTAERTLSQLRWTLHGVHTTDALRKSFQGVR